MDSEVPALELTTRPHKKMRRESTQVNNGGHESQRMYFELCPDSIENIVRCTSSSRNSKDWASFINSEDISSSSNVEGGIGEFITSRCNAISDRNGISSGRNKFSVHLHDKLFTMDSSGFWVDAHRKDIAFKLHRVEQSDFKRPKPVDKVALHFHGLNMLKSMSRSSNG